MVKSKTSMTAKARLAAASDFLDRHFVDQFGWKQPHLTHPERAALRKQGLNGSSMFQLYLDENMAYGKPDVMEPDEFDKYVKDNKLRAIYRGNADSETMSAVDMHENFMYDAKYYVGSGMFGDGQYFGTEHEAKQYAVTGYYVEGRGAVIKAALKPGARTITHARLLSEMNAEHPEFANRESMLSIYARSKGYDAILTDSSSSAYTCVLNRDALVISSNIRRMKDYDYV